MNIQLRNNPRLRDMYELYLMCRSTKLEIYEKPINSKGDKKVAPIIWPVGITTWPRAGGVYDQDYVESRMLYAFLRGDQIGTQKMMNRIR